MEGATRQQTLRERAIRAEEKLNRVKEADDADWTDVRRQLFVCAKKVNCHFLLIRNGWPDKFTTALHGVVEMCREANVPPEIYAKFFADNMLPWLQKQRWGCKPGHLVGKNAAERFNAWLDRTHRRNLSVRAGASAHTDDRVKERAQAADFVTLVFGLRGIPVRSRIKQARKLVGKPERRLLTVAVCDEVGRVHPQLPDVLELKRGWKLADVVRVVETMSA